MKKSPILSSFHSPVEAASAELSFKAWNQHCHLLLLMPIIQWQMQQRKCWVRESFFPLYICSGHVSKSECFKLLYFPCANMQSFEGLSGAICSELCHSDSEANNRGKQAIRSEVGTSLGHNVQLQLSLPRWYDWSKASAGDHTQGWWWWWWLLLFYLATRYFCLVLFKDMKSKTILYFL